MQTGTPLGSTSRRGPFGQSLARAYATAHLHPEMPETGTFGRVASVDPNIRSANGQNFCRKWTESCPKWPTQVSPVKQLEKVVSPTGFEPVTH